MVTLLTGKIRGIQWLPPSFIQWLHLTLRSLIHNRGYSVHFSPIFSPLILSKTVEMTMVAKRVELKVGCFEAGTANLVEGHSPASLLLLWLMEGLMFSISVLLGPFGQDPEKFVFLLKNLPNFQWTPEDSNLNYAWESSALYSLSLTPI